MSLISIDEFEETFTDIIRKELLTAEESLRQILDKRAKKLCKALADASPVDTGNYRDGWTYSSSYKAGSIVYIIYNQNRPELTWILEYGYIKQNGEFTPGKPHIRRTAENELDALVEELASKI